MAKNFSFQPNWASPPGDTILDFLTENDVSISDFSKQMEIKSAFTKRLLNGNEIVTDAIAEKLAFVIGSTKNFWLARESQYRNDLQYLKQEKNEKQHWLREFPIRDMINFGWIPKSKTSSEKEMSCLEFFDIYKREEWPEKYHDLLLVTSFRTSSSFDSKPESVITWLRKGEIEAEKVNCRPWNPTKFKKTLSNIRDLTRIKEPNVFLPRIIESFAECGVAVVIAPTPAKCTASGATYFLSPKKALLLLSFRHLSDDHFWFSLFHEAGHILLHGNKSLFLENIGNSNSKEEREANDFSADILIPKEHQDELRMLRANQWRDIIRFAKKVGVSPGIIVGQLQHLGIISHKQLNKLKTRYRWVKSE
jgi:Zn-dependent peptidase ImmA (M78 family)/plasmid maintenance system antidote protein VapI